MAFRKDTLAEASMASHGAVDSPPEAERRMTDYCCVVFRNVGDDYRRSARQWADPKSVSEDPAELQDGTLLEAPMEDGVAREAPQWPASLLPRLSFIGLPAPCPGGVGEPTSVPNAQTPKRSGDELQAPSLQHMRTAGGDHQFSGRFC